MLGPVARRLPALVLILMFAITASGCRTTSESSPPTTTVPSRPPKTVRVPGDHVTISDAVRAAVPGDLILVDAGTYREEVEVHVPGIVIRGLDRNAVILDGEFKRENGVRVDVDGVAVENLTVRNYTANGVFFTGTIAGAVPGEEGEEQNNPSHGDAPARPLDGYRASYITAVNNGLYGLYAFAARGGQFDHSYASGHPDSGFYIGQCKPCDGLVTDVVGERNAVGFEGTNASDGVAVVNSTWRGNRVGITFNSQDVEKLSPQGGAVVAGNLVVDNNGDDAPTQASGGYGLGVAIGGSAGDRVSRNRVTGSKNAGIAVTSLDTFVPRDNRVTDNVVQGNGTDLVYALSGGVTPLTGNCFSGNTFTTSTPPNIETAFPCTGTASGAPGSVRFAAGPPGPDSKSIPPPPPQPQMPDAATAPARPATSFRPPVVDVDRISVPAGP